MTKFEYRLDTLVVVEFKFSCAETSGCAGLLMWKQRGLALSVNTETEKIEIATADNVREGTVGFQFLGFRRGTEGLPVVGPFGGLFCFEHLEPIQNARIDHLGLPPPKDTAAFGDYKCPRCKKVAILNESDERSLFSEAYTFLEETFQIKLPRPKQKKEG